MASSTVRVEGLQKLRKALRDVDQGAAKQVQKTSKEAAQIVASEASALAPKRSGRLAASIRATTSGHKGIVRSRLPYAKVHEWGGVIRPRGAPITIVRSRYMGRALENKQREVARHLADGLNDVIRRAGWR